MWWRRCSNSGRGCGCGRNFVFIALLWICAAAFQPGNGLGVKNANANTNTNGNSFEYKTHGHDRDRDRDARTNTEDSSGGGTPPGHDGYHREELGYVAEWEYIGAPNEVNPDSDPLKLSGGTRSPADRIEPALWQDVSGSWWLYGGRSQGTAGNLADLWVYKPDANGKSWNWHPMLEPLDMHQDSGTASSFPEPSINSVLCGSSDGSTIALFGGDADGDGIDDNLVWIYKIPRDSQSRSGNANANPAHTEEEAAGDEGIWTSYMCCDVCDPTPDPAGSSNEKSNKTTTNLEFCPHFSQSSTATTANAKTDTIEIVSKDSAAAKPDYSKVEQQLKEKVNTPTARGVRGESRIKVTQRQPILWCAHDDSLMALQLTFSKSQNSVSHEHEHEGEGEEAEPQAHDAYAHSANKRSPKVSKELGESYSREEIESATFPSTSTKIHLADYNGEHQHGVVNVNGGVLPPSSSGAEAPAQLINEFPTTTPNRAAEQTRPITKSQRGFQQSEIGSAAKISSKDKNKFENNPDTHTVPRHARTPKLSQKTPEKYLNWWKFNLESKEWEKLPQVIMEVEIKDPDLINKLFDPVKCRTTMDGVYVYFICIPGHATTTSTRELYLLNSLTSTISQLPSQIQLNVLFADDPRTWSTPAHSVLHALRLPELNRSLLMIAYGKLIDFWIHDHETNIVRPAENVWKGSTLDRFQHHDQFYKLRISVLNCSREHVLFLPNPRHMTETATETGTHKGQNQNQLIFNDISSPSPSASASPASAATATPASSFSSGWFHIKLETDENIFLPSRDASFMINVGGDGEQEQTIEKPIMAANAVPNSNTTTTGPTLISPLPLPRGRGRRERDGDGTTGTTFSKVEQVEAEVGVESSAAAPPAAPAGAHFGVAVPPEQFPNEKEKIQFNSHSKVQEEEDGDGSTGEEPRALPLLAVHEQNTINNSSISRQQQKQQQNHDDGVMVIGKFNLNNLPSAATPSSSPSSSSSSFNLSSGLASTSENANAVPTTTTTNGKLETSSEGTTFMKFNNVLLSSLSSSQSPSQSQSQQKRFSLSSFRETVNVRKKPTAVLIFNGLANHAHADGEVAKSMEHVDADAGQGIDPNEHQPINQKVDVDVDGQQPAAIATTASTTTTTTNRLIMSPASVNEPQPQINNSGTVNITTNPESLHQELSQQQKLQQPPEEPEIEITLRQSSSSSDSRQSEDANDNDSPSPFSPSEELKLGVGVGNTVVELFTHTHTHTHTETGESSTGELVDVGNIVVDNNYSRSESVVEEGQNTGTEPGDSDSSDVGVRSLWQLAISCDGEGDDQTSSWSYASILFYSLSLIIFATAGILFFVRRCVKCTSCPKARGEKSDEHILFSESRARPSSGQLTNANATRRLPDEEFYLNTPIV